MIQAASAPSPAVQAALVPVQCTCGRTITRTGKCRCGAFNVVFTERQAQALLALNDPAITAVLYGGARGGGKTALGVLWVWIRCEQIIREFNLRPTDHPIPVGVMCRKIGSDFVKGALEQWYKLIPPDRYSVNQTAREITVGGCVKVLFGGLDSREDVGRFLGPEYGFLWIDQAEETVLDDVSDLRASLRMSIEGRPVQPRELYTANPGRCWLKDEFISVPQADHRFVRAFATDNPHLDPGYIERLTSAYKHRPELLEAYLYGSWDSFEGANQLIKERWILDARERRNYPLLAVRLVICDVARFGDDETCIYDMEDTQIVDEEIFGQRDTMYTANRIFAHVRKHGHDGKCLVVVDTTGVGSGVADRLVEMGLEVLQVDGAASAGDSERFHNLRAEMWWTAGEEFSDGEIALERQDQWLVGQLCTPTYTFRNGRVLVEAKDEIKKRLGRSPDRADCYVMGLYGRRYAMKRKWRPSEGVQFRQPAPVKPGPIPIESYAARASARREQAQRSMTW